MSDSQAYEEVTVASDGVTVVKRFEEDEFPVPAIAFEFTSRRDEAVAVRLSDVVPEGVEVEDLGFHPEYGSEYWTIDDERITFEREFEAESEYTTVYGIRATGTDNVEQFLTEPVIEEVDPPLPADADIEEPADSVIPETGDEVVRDVISGEGDIPGLDDDETDEDEGEEVETLDLKDPNAAGEEGESSGSAGQADVAQSVEGSVVTAMANEIRSNDVSVEDLKLLNRAFEKVAEETSDDTSGVTDARIQKVQSDVADLRAYTDALEEFLEEEGTGEQLIQEFETRLEEFSEDLNEMQSEVETMTETVDGMDEKVTTVSEEMDGVREDVTETESRMDELDGTVENIQETIEELESHVTEEDLSERLESMEEDVSDLRDWQDQIKQTFGG